MKVEGNVTERISGFTPGLLKHTPSVARECPTEPPGGVKEKNIFFMVGFSGIWSDLVQVTRMENEDGTIANPGV